ncbi:MAG: hypothetical protein WAV56_04640 [Microgenomates group bacterium]
MKKFTLPVLLASAFLFAACTPQAGPITGTEEQKAEKLAQIIESGGSADCTVTNLSDKTTTQMVISGKKMKIIGSDFGQGKKGTMINDTVYSYFWTEGEKTGFKSKLETEKETTPTPAGQEEQFDTESTVQSYEDETKFKLDCARRTVSDSEFVPPQEVKFVDPSELNTMTPEELQKLYPVQE